MIELIVANLANIIHPDQYTYFLADEDDDDDECGTFTVLSAECHYP